MTGIRQEEGMAEDASVRFWGLAMLGKTMES
jgi:hypothetical protein